MGSVECYEQGLFWESPTTTKGNSWRGVCSTGNLPKALCLSRVSLTQWFDERPGNMQLLECIKWGWVFSCLVCVFLGNVGMGLLLLVCVFVCQLGVFWFFMEETRWVFLGKICQTIQFPKYFSRIARVQTYLVSWTFFGSRF